MRRVRCLGVLLALVPCAWLGGCLSRGATPAQNAALQRHLEAALFQVDRTSDPHICNPQPGWEELLCAAAFAQDAYHRYSDADDKAKLDSQVSDAEPNDIRYAVHEAQTHWRRAASYQFLPPYLELRVGIGCVGGERRVDVCIHPGCRTHNTESVTLLAEVTASPAGRARVTPVAVISARGQVILAYDGTLRRLKPYDNDIGSMLTVKYTTWKMGDHGFWPLQRPVAAQGTASPAPSAPQGQTSGTVGQ